MKKHTFLGFLLSLMLIVGVMPAAAFAADSEAPTTLDISKSKEATQLKKIDGKYESTVTLSLPSAEKQLTTDVVFVLDKSTSASLEEQALKMLSDLKSDIADSGAKVKVGVVIFNKKANVTDFKDLGTQYSDIEAAIKQEIKSGTNTHAGLLAAEKMLDNDTSVSADRKYMVFVSDGITYMFNENPTAVAWNFDADGAKHFAGPDNWNSQYGNNDAPANWTAALAKISEKIKSQGSSYDYSYGTEPKNLTALEKQSAYANSVEKALYLTAQEYQKLRGKYNCYAMNAGTNSGSQYLWGPSFMNYLAGGRSVDFTKIHNDILYLVDSGSTVVDYMGYVANDYNFDLKDLSSVKLTVGGEELKPTIDGNKIHWGTNYTLTYTPAKDGEEHFELKLNTPVKISQPVQLSYTVVLQNPKTEAGTYGVYDKYGENHENGLFTNNSAVLNPVDTNKIQYAGQEFGKPTVSYTVSASATPTQPTDKPAATSKTAKTGDDSHIGLWIALALASALGLTGAAVLFRRKHA